MDAESFTINTMSLIMSEIEVQRALGTLPVFSYTLNNLGDFLHMSVFVEALSREHAFKALKKVKESFPHLMCGTSGKLQRELKADNLGEVRNPSVSIALYSVEKGQKEGIVK